MKKLLAVFVATVFVLSMGVIPVFADTPTSVEDISFKPYDDLVLGAKFDAPNLIQITDNLTIGIEGSKDLLYTNAKEGWTAYGKLTYHGCLFLCK